MSGFDHKAYARSAQSIASLKATLPDDAVRSLAREVVTRLASQSTRLRAHDAIPTSQDINRLCHALIDEDAEAAAQMVMQIRREGASLEAVYLSFLAEAARTLGLWWEDDRISFVAVTIATGRIYAIMRALREGLGPMLVTHDQSVCFASVPGETHTLGVRMAADLFRKKGWDVSLHVGLDHDDLVASLSASAPAVIGLSAGHASSSLALARLILALRVTVPRAALMVSGQILEDSEEIVALMDPDLIVHNVPEAIEAMDQLAARL